MTQLSLGVGENNEWPETYIIISLAPRYYHELIVAQSKQHEFRRGKFIQKPVTAFVYATLAKSKYERRFPSGEIGGVVKLGMPITGIEEVIKVKESERPGSRTEMVNWLDGFSTASAHPVESVVRFENPVSLAELRKESSGFQPPQRYKILRQDDALLTFLKKRSGAFN